MAFVSKKACVVRNVKFDRLLRKYVNKYLLAPGCLTALQLGGVWEEVATGTRESGSQSFLLVSIKIYEN